MPLVGQLKSVRIVGLVFLTAVMLALPLSGTAQINTESIERHQLANGLSVIFREEHTFPSVSVQVLYRVGGRNEPAGQSGIAHFVEHMAFRATENFPDTEVVSQIYAAGGEWHGYTWIDQTTYFATVPSAQLDTLLRIEADRMQRLLIEDRWIEPEKGAVLAEMHGYENDPAAVLHDAVVFQAFLAHPYRNNVIGWERDILALRPADVKAFYQQHYRPANAVLVVVGDFSATETLQQVQELFGRFPAASATPLPHSLEPPQLGERRIDLLGAGDSSYFEVAYPAPAANQPDFASLLVLQEWLSGGSGVNFMQEYGSTAARPGSALYGQLENLDTWFPPAAQPYLFSIRGSAADNQSGSDVEQIIDAALRKVRQGELAEAEIQRARDRVLEELVFDLGTHEELAHQLAYYDGLDALDEWLELPERVQEVNREQLRALADRYFQPWQRTIGWYRAGDKPEIRETESLLVASTDAPRSETVKGVAFGPSERKEVADSPVKPGATQILHGPSKLPPTQSIVLKKGLPLLLQENPAATSAYISLIVNGNQWQGSSYLQTDQPIWGVSSLSIKSLPHRLKESLAILRAELDQLQASQADADGSSDPSTRLVQMTEGLLGLPPQEYPSAELVSAVLTGQIDAGELESISKQLASIAPAKTRQQAALTPQTIDLVQEWPTPLAQAQLAYVVGAPLPKAQEYLAWRALQYILAHDYEGRLGKEAISNRGLAYYIDSQYQSNGQSAWISLSTGVDPAKLADLEKLFRNKIRELASSPPTESEVEEAKNHMAGRLLTARQSNAELAEGLAQQWLWFGQIATPEKQLAAISQLNRQQVLAAIADFTEGNFVTIVSGKAAGNVTD